MVILLTTSLVACDDQPITSDNTPAQPSNTLTSLQIQSKPADYALPFCEKKNCLTIDIQSVVTQQLEVNQWIEKQQSYVIQQLIDSDQNLTLQEAVNAYVKKSDTWQAEDKKNKSYQLNIMTRVASQRQQYLLIQFIVNAVQGETHIKNQKYFVVLDRQQQKKVSLLDLLKTDHQHKLNEIIQIYYQEWKAKQVESVQEKLPEKVYWGQTDWFFDQEGIGLHYRKGQIGEDSPAFDLYLTPEQGKAVLQESIYHTLFPQSSS